MKKFFILKFIFTTSFLLGQDIPLTIQKSAVFEDDYKDSKIVLAEKYNENNDLIIVRSFEANISATRGFYIEKYNQNLDKTSDYTFEIDHPLDEKYSKVIGVFYKDEKINIIEIFYNLRSKYFICQVNSINQDYKLTKKELFRLSKEDIKGFGLNSIFYNSEDLDIMDENSGNFKLESPNNEFLSSKKSKASFSTNARSEVLMRMNKQKSLFSIALTYQNGKKSYLKLFLFDSMLNKKLEKNIIDDYKTVVRQNIELDNKLEVIYLTQKEYLQELKDKDNGGKYTYEIKKITPSYEKTKRIDIKDYYVSSLQTVHHNDKLYTIGFYSDENDFRYNGICYFELDSQNFELNKSKYSLFDEQFIIDKYGKLKDKQFKNIVLKQVFFNSKNEVFINAEEVYLSSSGANAPNPIGGFGYSKTFFNYDDIIAIKLNKNGEIETARNINKSQASGNEDESCYISYSSFLVNGKNIFFINANDKVKKLSNDRIEFGSVRKNKSNLNLIEIDDNGDFDFIEILDDESNEVPFMVSKGILIDNSVVFFGRRGKKKQLIKVTLE